MINVRKIVIWRFTWDSEPIYQQCSKEIRRFGKKIVELVIDNFVSMFI